MTKAQLLEEIKPLPAGLVGSLEVAHFKMELHTELCAYNGTYRATATARSRHLSTAGKDWISVG